MSIKDILYFKILFVSPFGVLSFFILLPNNRKIQKFTNVSVSSRSSILFYKTIQWIYKICKEKFPSPFGVLSFFIKRKFWYLLIWWLVSVSFRSSILFYFISKLKNQINTSSFRLLSEFYPFLYFKRNIKSERVYKSVSVSFRSSILFYGDKKRLYTRYELKVSVSFRSSILFYPLTLTPYFMICYLAIFVRII